MHNLHQMHKQRADLSSLYSFLLQGIYISEYVKLKMLISSIAWMHYQNFVHFQWKFGPDIENSQVKDIVLINLITF